MTDDPVETLLDDNGKGVLTEELRRIFVANGCQPACHICRKAIQVGDELHLKAFFAKTTETDLLDINVLSTVDTVDGPVLQVDSDSETTSSIDVMICIACSNANRKLPEGEANKLLALAQAHGLIEDAPERSHNFGSIAPHWSTSSNSRQGARSRFGGCMIVRKAGESIKIAGAHQLAKA